MTFGQAIRSGFQNYASWQGRATRSEYWWWALFAFIVTLPFSIANQVSTQVAVASGNTADAFGVAFWLLILVGLALFLPGLAVLVRRLHDTDRSGGWYWIALVPFAGGIVLFVFMLLAGTAGRNRYDVG